MESSSDLVSMATKVNTKHESHLMRLPTEIREMIYRYLLVAEYTMTEPNMTTKEYNRNRQNIQWGPDQTYQFHTAILGTNRRIYGEARDLCRRENDFVSLTSEYPSHLGYKLEEWGLQILAKRSKSCGFWNPSMILRLDPDAFRDWSEDAEHWSYIFCSDELPHFCRLLLEMSIDDVENLLCTTTRSIDIVPLVRNGQVTEIDSHPAGLSRMGRLLDPLHQLHSLGAAQIDGPLSGSYKGHLISSICKDCPSAADIIHTTMVSLNQADEQARNGRLLQANVGYKEALNIIRSCCWRYSEKDVIMENGPFPGLRAMDSISNIVVRLQARIAAVYVEREKLRMARIYTERALDPRRKFDDRSWKVHELDIEPWEGVAYAEVFDVAAKISYKHGGVWEAIRDLEEAGALVPLNEEQTSRLERWQNRMDSLERRHKKKKEAKDLHSERQNEKNEEMFLVACNRKDKGDRLLQSGRSDLAASTYKTALSKIDLIFHTQALSFSIKSGRFEGYRPENAIEALRFKVQAGLAAAYLKSRKYKDVIRWTDTALACSSTWRDCDHQDWEDCCPKYWDESHDWMEDQKIDYLKLHYSKAMALRHKGFTSRAIGHLELALSFSRGDGTVKQLDLSLEEDALRIASLQELKSAKDLLRKKQIARKEKAREDAVRIARLYKLNSSQDRLRKKQINRKEKASV